MTRDVATWSGNGCDRTPGRPSIRACAQCHSAPHRPLGAVNHNPCDSIVEGGRCVHVLDNGRAVGRGGDISGPSEQESAPARLIESVEQMARGGGGGARGAGSGHGRSWGDSRDAPSPGVRRGRQDARDRHVGQSGCDLRARPVRTWLSARPTAGDSRAVRVRLRSEA